MLQIVWIILRKVKFLFVFFVCALLLSGCFVAPGMTMQSVPSNEQLAQNEVKPHFIPITVSLVRYLDQHSASNQSDAYYYHIGAHDVLSVYVWEHPELASPTGQAAAEGGTMTTSSMSSAGYLVGPDGYIYFPLVGNVSVAGKTVEQTRTELTGLLRKYIRNPQLDVRVIGFRSKKIYVMGEVLHPGLIPMTDSPMSITDALNLSGGLDQKSADPSHVFVIRGNYAKPEVYWLNTQSPDALLLGANFRLQAQDVVFVSTANVARWNRAIDQILPTIQTVWFTYSLVKAINT